MTTKELYRLLDVLNHIKKPNPFVDEVIAYVQKDLALRNQQSKIMREMNHPDREWDGRW